jgi:zinc protease
MPGRPLAAMQLLMRGGAATESATENGTAALLARLLTEGGPRHDAIRLVEAAELLGGTIGAEAGFEGVSVGSSLPVHRIAPMLDLIAEIAYEPSLPEREVDRLRALRLAQIEQAAASPRARANEAITAAIYDDAPYGRPIGGRRESVAAINRASLSARHAQLVKNPDPLFVIAGEFDPNEIFALIDASALARGVNGSGASTSPAAIPLTPDRPAAATTGDGPRVLLIDRPGSVQSELRIGRLGRSRLDAGFHAALVHSEIVGGLFGSRLNRVLREEKGYTYGAAAGFDFRRGRGPFLARTAVETSVTVPALVEARRQLSSPLSDAPSDEELDGARRYLIGTFPLRFGAAPPVAAAASGLTAIGLDLSELDRYRDAVAAVDRAAVVRVAEELEAESERIVVVGDAATVRVPLEAAGFTVEVQA